MGQEIKLINKDIPLHNIDFTVEEEYIYIVDFKKYNVVESILIKNKEKGFKKLSIYDITNHRNKKDRKTVAVNDHINRIGFNPFIGKQSNYNIDFINIEKLYYQTEKGVTTYSCGEKENHNLTYTSTHLANIATLGKIFNFQIKGFLVNSY
jgi:hypothetical protein